MLRVLLFVQPLLPASDHTQGGVGINNKPLYTHAYYRRLTKNEAAVSVSAFVNGAQQVFYAIDKKS